MIESVNVSQSLLRNPGNSLAVMWMALAVAIAASFISLILAVQSRTELAELRKLVADVDDKHVTVIKGLDGLEKRQDEVSAATLRMFDKTAEIAMQANERALSVERKFNTGEQIQQ